jgi:hypothetical protein
MIVFADIIPGKNLRAKITFGSKIPTAYRESLWSRRGDDRSVQARSTMTLYCPSHVALSLALLGGGYSEVGYFPVDYSHAPNYHRLIKVWGELMLQKAGVKDDAQFSIRAVAQRNQYALPIVICVAFFGLALMFAPEKPLISGDSPSYIEFWSQRTAGYPIFLNIVGLFDSQLRTLPLLQLLILCGATLLFSLGMRCLTQSYWSATAVVLLLLGNVEVLKYSFWILSDGLFISSLAAILGAFAFWLGGKRLIWLVPASMFLGVAMSIRPASFPLLAILPILYVYAWYMLGRCVGTFALMLVPAAIVIFLSLAAYHQWHGSWRPNSVLGLNLLGKAALLAKGNEPSARPAWIAVIAKVGADYRERLGMGETWADRSLLTAARYDNIRQSLGLYPGENSAFPTDELGTGSTADRAFTEVALDIIRAHKLAYLRQVLDNYVALWYIPQLLTRDDATRLKRIIVSQVSPSDLANEISSIPTPRSWPVVIFTHLFQLFIFIISIIFLISLPVQLIMRRRADVFIWFGFAAAVVLHASILVIAAINESKPRLLLDTWPLEVLLAVLALAVAGRVMKSVLLNMTPTGRDRISLL